MMALTCKTQRIMCCNRPYRHGDWYYMHPEGTRIVPRNDSGNPLYRDRKAGGQVRLNKRHDSRVNDTGIYCCVVPDSNDKCGINQTLCVNLGKYLINYVNV